MNEKYRIEYHGNATYSLQDRETNIEAYLGSLAEINAWLELKEKGFEV